MKILSIVLILAGLLIIAGCSAIPPETQKSAQTNVHGHADISENEISPGDLYKKLSAKDNFILLDVREKSEYEEAHIPGTTNLISVQHISKETLETAGIKPSDQIVVYCRSGSRSSKAQKTLNELGYTNVLNMSGGIIHWIEDEFPTETGEFNPTYESPTITDSAIISFDKTKYDFGEIPQFGGTVSTDFIVYNEGTSPLEIGTLTTSCACTSATIDQSTIAPGSQTTLHVTFDPNLHEEPLDKFKRTIFIPTNDPNSEEAELTISVDILENQ